MQLLMDYFMLNMKKYKFKPIYDPEFLVGVGECKPKKVFKFTWDYCAQCDCMFVRCPMCGNNCCNAGFGTVDKNFKPVCWSDKAFQASKKNTQDCPVCNLAYQFQHLGWKTKTSPPLPSKKIRKEEKKKLDDSWKLLGVK